MVQKAEALTDDAEKAVRESNLDHWIPPQKKCENTNGNSQVRSLNLLPHFLGGNSCKTMDTCQIYGTILRDFRFPGKEPPLHCLGWFFYPTGKPPEKYHQNSKLAALVASGRANDGSVDRVVMDHAA